MRRISPVRLVVGSVALAAAAIILAAAVAGARRRAEAPAATADRPPERAPDWLRGFVTRRFNPLVVRLGLVGGPRSPWALIEHLGRRSGSVYRTPVLPMHVGDWMVVPLPYGPDVDWVRNVRTAGHCRMQQRGIVFELDEPALIPAGEHPGIPEWYRARLERRGRRYLRLHVLSAAPGTLDSVAPATSGAPLAPSPAAA